MLLWTLAILAVLNSQSKTGTQAGKNRTDYSVKTVITLIEKNTTQTECG
jgi:hypothetical protein